jgi:hypothetical protein
LNELCGVEKKKWVVCHNGKDIHHIIELSNGIVVTSGLPYLDSYETEEEALKAVPVENAEKYSSSLKEGCKCDTI